MTAFARLGDPIPPLAIGDVVQSTDGIQWTVGLLQAANFPQAAVKPTSGTHFKGQIWACSNPVPGGYAFFICTTAGTPGIINGFGAIEP